jgi:GT2 family glycosyltransferase
MTTEGQPRVRRNEWRHIRPPAVGDWTPSLTVTVVIPAFNAHRTLPLTLASLAHQTYPAELMDVVVLDNGSEPAHELPDVRPARTRIIRADETWGSAYSVAVAAAAATGDVILRLDSDMVVYRDHVEAQMRWHHLLDYAVVLGHKMFVDPDERPEAVPGPAEVAEATAAATSAQLFPGMTATRHEWIERVFEQTDDLNAAGPTAWAVHVGATASMHAALFRAAGGMDTTLKLGSDTEVGYRLGQVGAVFIPDHEARSWHVGSTNIMRNGEATRRYNTPFMADRIGQLRYRRPTPGRQYTVPRLQVTVDVSSATYEQAQATLDGFLSNTDVDLLCQCVGPWSSLDDSRGSPLKNPLRELRMIAAAYRGDSRVRFVGTADSPFPSPFAMEVPAGWRPEPGSIAALLSHMETQALGQVSVLMPDQTVAVLERVAARARLDRLIREGEDRTDAMDELYGTWWFEGVDVGFRSWDVPASPSADDTIARLRAELFAARTRIAALEENPSTPAVASSPRVLPRQRGAAAWQRLQRAARASV